MDLIFQKGADMKEFCGAWWCENPIKQIRKVDGIAVCRPCYQYVWEQAKKMGIQMETAFRVVEPPQRNPVRKRIRCSRPECGVVLTPRMDSSEYRWLNRSTPVCRNCYQTTWEYKEKHGLSSMQEAFDKLYPKGWRPPTPEPVKCAMPWCACMVPQESRHAFNETTFVCSECRRYLHVLSRRYTHAGHDWKWYASNAMRGMVPAPGAPERCAAKWCNRIVGDSGQRGPNGEAVCNTDRLYFYNYGRRHDITFDDAFRTAPPPRLLHTRVE
ncbi:MAG: hypothetical protein A2758_02145 [Candidatus Zambryskibacteria bacterium RIFCSPHIGHO2_01_FULL_49_18]|uniref:Uncharacterized protein n=2 Tax=Candidatus Zambryskiibacteriota TaxID=1817925 RepID=A0A1G2T1U4_9BACT|nr:MAG: hypothetical protein A2758_02145 [Candidatus Zambryskibacteria bacterium RIFCSPHIGHO2_01_FULL_49_18]OHB06126.1 MAG: hypothetical protein A3A26_01105 [Candidatus Zambryskibacteria bacterium RIFCSPLOWO2_01_FULL_47_14]